MRSRFPLFLPLLGLLLSSACYTLIDHPNGVTEGSYATGRGEAGLRDCRECHDGFEYGFYHPGSRWRRPYTRRWWYDDYRFQDDYDYGYGWGHPYPPSTPEDGEPGQAGDWDASRRRKRETPGAEAIVPGSSAGRVAQPRVRPGSSPANEDATADEKKPEQDKEDRKRRKKHGK